MKVALTIAGSDSGGGAGIQADLKTFEAHGLFGTSAITSITAQNTVEVRQVFDIPIDVLAAQIDAVFDDFPVAVVKIGMLSTTAIIRTVAERLERYAGQIPIVLDPVMVASSGDRLLRENALAALFHHLITRATIITPNALEASILSGMPLDSTESMMRAARRIQSYGSNLVLIKGGDVVLEASGEGWSDDVLFDGRSFLRFRAPRIGQGSRHGTGCTLASAIASNLALGYGISDAIRLGKDYVHAAITHAPAIGHGPAPLRHSL